MTIYTMVLLIPGLFIKIISELMYEQLKWKLNGNSKWSQHLNISRIG